MKALTCKPKWAAKIVMGQKTIELRSWYTKYRGDILLCSSATGSDETLPEGYALGIIRIDEVVPFQIAHAKEAGFEEKELQNFHGYSWKIFDVRPIKPFAVKGRLSLFDLDVFTSELVTVALSGEQLLKYWIQNGICFSQ